ncbi:MAG: squalene synthase HpnC [Phycisphaerales bacterium]|nr:squalene synthase HpnC [Phycisphaerales bacterium]
MAHGSVVVQDMARLGPSASHATPPSLAESRAYCRTFTRAHAENFSVLSALVPRRCRDDFATVYAFCRWADDLGDEFASREESLAHLAWWRAGLLNAFTLGARNVHPVFIALADAAQRLNLDEQPFVDLMSAFELDQSKSRYATWDELLGYCALSANPVGRIVLKLLGEPCTAQQLAASDALCTALQLTNHWQDVRRDLAMRDRIYIPQEISDAQLSIKDFEFRFRATIDQGFACDGEFFEESRQLLRVLVDRTWPLYEQGESLFSCVRSESSPLLWLFAAGGSRTLRLIELWNYETVLHRPKMLAVGKLWLVARAHAMRLRGGTA